jgi:signal transduction histidine kinase
MRATEQVGAKVAHELKNPLAGIKALLQLVRGGEGLAAKAGERLGVALAEVDRMDDIVRDYLAFARPLADLELAPVDPRAIADDVLTVLAARAELGTVAIEVRGRTREIVGDARRLREAVLNLADNALAATPSRGSVTLSLAEDAAGITLAIEDTGPGLAPGFEPAPYATTKPDGTGLGLTIARAAIAQHGGTLELAPREPNGTRAIIRLPFYPEKP